MIVSILVGLSTVSQLLIRTLYSTVYGLWPYVIHAFRQSADSSGLCRIQLVWSRHGFEVLCRRASAPIRSW